ncbi:MAG: hypothetical protein ABSG31_17715 [Tepidisphaeraceae bacterium]|jgi:hypothetical protein
MPLKMAIRINRVEQSGGPRHTAYPYYTLPKSLELAGIVNELGGTNGEVQKSLLAHSMKVEEDSPTLAGVLGAAKLYLLVEGRGSFRLTEIAKQYFHPTSDSDRRLAMLKMIKGPPLFDSLIEQFDGQKLPAPEMLANILHRNHSIAPSWRVRAASLFLSTLQFADVIDSTGVVRYSAAIHGSAGKVPVPPPQMPPDHSAEDVTQTVLSVRDEPLPKPGVTVWAFHGIRLEAPEKMGMELWKKLINYVNVLKPEGGNDPNEAGREQ